MVFWCIERKLRRSEGALVVNDFGLLWLMQRRSASDRFKGEAARTGDDRGVGEGHLKR